MVTITGDGWQSRPIVRLEEGVDNLLHALRIVSSAVSRHVL